MKRVPGLTTLVAMLVAAFLFQTLSTLRSTAPTFDEVAHLPAGYVQLTTGDYHLNPEHPPLAKLLAALPLLSQRGSLEVPGPEALQLGEWEYGRRFLFGDGRDPGVLMVLGRLPMVALGLMLCLVCLLWSWRAYGAAGGLTSLALCALSPTLLAHTRLVTTDVPVAFFGTLTAYLAWEQMNRSRWTGSLAAGLAFGAALASKFTGILFGPAVGLAVIHILWRRSDELEPAPKRVWRGALLFLLAGVAAFSVLTLSYGVPISLSPYLDGIRHIGFNHTPGYAFYMLGEYRPGGFPLYFPAAFLMKSSPALLITLGLLGLLPLLRRVRLAVPVQRARVPVGWFLALPALSYGLFISLTAPDIGVRYLVPVYPFLFISAGMLGAALWPTRAGRLLLLVLLTLHVRAAVDAYPDQISYFNGLFGCRGPAAIACLDDSNLDWGQDLEKVADAVNRIRGPGEQVALLYFGTALPTAYLQNWRAMQDDEILIPRQQLYAVSLHRLNRLIARLGRPNDMDWYQRFTPVAIVGNTYFIYDFRSHLSDRAPQTVPDARPEGVPSRASLERTRNEDPSVARAVALPSPFHGDGRTGKWVR